MKNLKTLLALALSLSMCVSLAACGSSADDDDEDKAEKKTPTSSAAAAEKESDEKTESKAEAEESTAESNADESEATESESVESESEPVVLTHDVDLVKFAEDIVSPCIYKKNAETTGKAITDFLQISEKVEANEWGSFDMDFPEDLTFSGIHFSKMIVHASDVGEESEYVRQVILFAECDPSKTETPEETGMKGHYYNPLCGDIESVFKNAGYTEKGGAFELNSGCSVEAETARDQDNIPTSVTLTFYL